jgi:hypothetical protein
MLLQGRATNIKDMLRTGSDELNAAGRVGGEFRVIFAPPSGSIWSTLPGGAEEKLRVSQTFLAASHLLCDDYRAPPASLRQRVRPTTWIRYHAKNLKPLSH